MTWIPQCIEEVLPAAQNVFFPAGDSGRSLRHPPEAEWRSQMRVSAPPAARQSSPSSGLRPPSPRIRNRRSAGFLRGEGQGDTELSSPREQRVGSGPDHGEKMPGRADEGQSPTITASGIALIRPSATFSPNAMNNMERNYRGEGQRAGFTLLELLLAVGMTTLLMAAVYGAMSTYWNLALDSREEITRSQIARSIMHELSRDIRSVTFVEQVSQSSGASGSSSNTGGSTSGGSTSGSSGSSSSGTGSSSSSLSAPPESVCKNGLIGTQRDLILYVSWPDKDLNYVALPDTLTAASRNSDLMIVRWLMADQSGSGLGSAIAATTQTGPGGVAGLARGAGGVNGFGRAIEMDDIGQQVEVTSLVAAEVEEIVFEYFDGVDWLTEWNSGELNKMPQAIRIQLTLREPPSDDSRSSNPRALPPTTHQLVVPIPVAPPFVQETAL